MMNEFKFDVLNRNEWLVLSIKKELQEIIKNSLKKSNIDVNLSDIVIEIPKQKENGDYSTNIALTLTKKLKKSPIIIAEEIIKNIKDKNISQIEIANALRYTSASRTTSARAL